ncbi:MAG: heat-inducible transcriptional repressor HrcA [Balneolales bacterium]
MSFGVYPELSNREQEVLEYIIQNFIVTANPIASNTLVKKHRLNISSASVRSVMSSLERKGFLDHPHTSAGRVPTELGYRFYVNTLMKVSDLSVIEKDSLDKLNSFINVDMDDAVKSAARILARLSNLLAVVVAPKLAAGYFRKIELISLSSNRLMIVLSVESGLIKTISVEVEAEFSAKELEHVAGVLNERLSGLVLNEIPKKIHAMLSDFEVNDKTGLIRVFMDSADSIFEDHQLRNFHFGGVEYIAMQPEFSDLSNYRSIVELVENEDLIIHLFDETEDENMEGESSLDKREVKVRIGTENKIQQIEQCSVVSANYNIGSITGTIGLVGPTRMNYSRMIALVEQLANRFNKSGFDN